MPAKIKTTPRTQEALRALLDSRDPLVPEHDPVGLTYIAGTTYSNRLLEKMDRWPRLIMLQRRVRIEGTGRTTPADPLVRAVWATLPAKERKRMRLFAHCADCGVRFTKRGAIADALRCNGKPKWDDPPTEQEQLAAQLRAAAEPPELAPQNEFEQMVVEVWGELTSTQRRTLYAMMRPSVHAREWALEGAPSRGAWASRKRAAREALARALAARYEPGTDYSLKTGGRRGFDYDRFFGTWEFGF